MGHRGYRFVKKNLIVLFSKMIWMVLWDALFKELGMTTNWKKIGTKAEAKLEYSFYIRVAGKKEVQTRPHWYTMLDGLEDPLVATSSMHVVVEKPNNLGHMNVNYLYDVVESTNLGKKIWGKNTEVFNDFRSQVNGDQCRPSRLCQGRLKVPLWEVAPSSIYRRRKT